MRTAVLPRTSNRGLRAEAMARILVIEDEIQLREMLQEMLERAGHDVMATPNGEAGVTCYRQEGANVVVTDIEMPRKNGFQVIQELRCDFPDIKIIAISGGGSRDKLDSLSHAEMLGAQRTLRKPFHMQHLLDAVAELLGKER